MRNKIFSGLLFLSTAAVIIASVLIAVIMYQGSMTTMQRDLRQEATFIKMGLQTHIFFRIRQTTAPLHHAISRSRVYQHIRQIFRPITSLQHPHP